MFDSGYLAVCTVRDLGWRRVHRIVHKRSRVLEHFASALGLSSLLKLASAYLPSLLQSAL